METDKFEFDDSKPSLDLAHRKGTDRIQINNLLSAVSMAALSVLLSTDYEFNTALIGQLALSVPLLIISSLSYAKIAYRPIGEIHVWDNYGWWTHTVGLTMIMNAMALLLWQTNNVEIAIIFIAVNISLYTIYSVIDIFTKRSRMAEKLRKICIHILLILCGALLPILYK